MYGNDYPYAASRLNGTVVCTNEGVPVSIDGISPGRGNCDITVVETGEHKIVHLDAINAKPVRLGFVNYRGRAVFVVRIPRRAGPGNQGLRRENSTSIGGAYPPMNAMVKTIKNEYPSFANAMTASKKGEGYSCAWHRHWAVKEGKQLLHKGVGVVGTINSKKEFELDKKFEYLTEYLREVLYG